MTGQPKTFIQDDNKGRARQMRGLRLILLLPMHLVAW